MIDFYKKLKSPFKLGTQTFPNRLWLASGTIGFGEDLIELIDINKPGGLVLKGTTLEPKDGNPLPRLAETPSGLLNAIGLQNPGIHAVIKDKLPLLQGYKTPLILNIAGKNMEEYETLAKIIGLNPMIHALEVNLSCPNVEKVMDMGTNPAWIESIIKKIKTHCSLPVIAKITPNVTDITSLALAAENGGADAVSLINTLLGMAFDTKTQAPVLANKMGGLSGPAIKPIAVRMVYQVRQKTKLPIIGMGGIMTLNDIFEFFCAGADAVQLGTANFIDIVELNKLLAYV
ncbi:dihydroorotate dehydrogenase [Thermoproteota archaeon]